MMRIIILLLFILFMRLAYGQERWLVGVGITYCSDIDSPGININATYRLVGNFYIGPDFSALLTNDVNSNGQRAKRKELEYNFNVHQIFDLSENFGVYPLIGYNVSKVTMHPEGETARTMFASAFNAGGGAEWKLRRVRLFLESKYVTNLSKVDITTGIIFPL